MRKTTKAITGIVVAAAVVVSSFSIVPDASAAPKAKKIVMNKKAVELKVGETFKLKVKKVNPKKASKAVNYKLNKKGKAVVSVSKKGLITAKAVGAAKITVTAKSNKKAKATVNVKVVEAAPVATEAPVATSTVAPTTAPSVAPTAAATTKPTAKPTRTPRPTAAATAVPTATPKPTAPPNMGDPAAPYTLTFSDETVIDQDDANHTIANGAVTINITAQYGGVAFVVPESMKGNNYDTVTVTYTSSSNVAGSAFGCGLWRSETGNREDDKLTEDVVAWEGVFNNTGGGTYTATMPAGTETNAYYINKALFFCNDSDALANGPVSATITKVEFSHSQYGK